MGAICISRVLRTRWVRSSPMPSHSAILKTSLIRASPPCLLDLYSLWGTIITTGGPEAMRIKVYPKIASRPKSTRVISATICSTTPPATLLHMAGKPMTSLGTRFKNKPTRLEDPLAETLAQGINEILPVLTVTEDSDEQQYTYTAQRVGYVLPASWSSAHARAPQSCHIQGYLFNAFPMDFFRSFITCSNPCHA